MMVNPVTVTADVAVKKDSHKPTSTEEHKGVARRTVPRQITSNPVNTVNWGTVILRYQGSFNLTDLDEGTDQHLYKVQRKTIHKLVFV